MRKIIEDVRFIQDGTMVFGDIHLEDGFVERIDYKSLKMNSDYAISGFVDVHTHGFCGICCDNTDVDELHKLAEEYARRGTVGFCPTLSVRSLKEYEAIIDAYREAFQGEYKGARFLGFHLEGPYVNPMMVCDENKKRVPPIDLGELETFMKKHHDMIAIMTIAPELDHAMEAIRILHRYGVIISLGYSCSDYETALQAIREGASHITHVCNRMNEIDYRRPGLIDAALMQDVMCELDMDGVHVNEIMLRWLMKLLGPKRVMAISNGGKYCGFEYPDGFELEDGGIVKNRVVYREEAETESTKDLLETFQFLFHTNDYDLYECIRMTSLNALQRLHVFTGEISLGKKVNLAVMTHDMEIKDVIINGKSTY